MDKQEFTEAGKAGQNIRSGLSTLFKNYKRGFINPILNIVPEAVNLSAAGTEAAAGMLNIPYRAGRLPLYETGPEVSPPTTGKKETIQDTPIQQEEETPTITVSKPRRKPLENQDSKRINYVVKTYGDNPTSEIFTDKKQALNALKGLYAKNQKATMSNVPEEQAQEFAVGGMERIIKNKEAIRKLRSPQTEEEIMRVAENKGRMEEAWKAANEEKRAKDKEAGAEFASWRSKVKAGRESEGMLNTYNQQLGLLKNAYTQAKQAGDPLAAYQIQEYIQEYQAGVPKEMGARKKFAESGALQEKAAMLQKKMQEAREQAERERRLARVNPDYNR